MQLFIGTIILIANILIAIDVAKILGVRRVTFAILMSIGVLVCGYNLLFNLLGLFKGINTLNVFIFEFALIGFFSLKRRKQLIQIISDIIDSVKRERTYFLIISPLLIIVILSSFILPPNNNDSMCYHLARVVHWMQNGDINYYFTSIERQNRMGPGAEVLILILQLVTNSDRLAVCVQLISFLFICISLPDILKLIGIKKYRTFIAVFTVSTPMLLFQAATTQNDLVSAIITLAIILLLLKLYKVALEKISYPYFILIGITFAAAYLVKPTGVLMLVPMVIFVAAIVVLRNNPKHYVFKSTIAGVLLIALCYPDVYRKTHAEKDQKTTFDDVLFPLTSQWNSTRAFNVFLAGMHHSPFSYAKNDSLIAKTANMLNAGYDSVAVTKNWNFIPHEDYIGNPIQFAMFIFLSIFNLIVLLVSRFRSRYIISLLPLISFLTMGLFIKDNPWVSRIQLPFFIIIPFCFVVVDDQKSRLLNYLYRIGAPTTSLLSLGIGFLSFSQNTIRPLSLEYILQPPDPLSIYYRETQPRLADHKLIMDLCHGNQLKTVGVLASPYFIEYPIAWQLYREGIPLKHVKPNDLQGAELIYLETHFNLRIDLKKYVKLNDKFYMVRKPITTLARTGKYDLPLSSLLIKGGDGERRASSIFFYGDGSLTSQKIKMSKGTYQLEIQTSGVLVDGAGSHWSINLEGKKIGDLNSISKGQSDLIKFTIDNDGDYELKLQFDNDIWDPVKHFDRNGEIEKIILSKK